MKRLDNRSVRSVLRAALCAGVTLSAWGCGPSRSAPTSPGDSSELPNAQDITERAADVRKLALEFELTAGELQGTPLTRQRPQIRQVFTQLSAVLAKLAGPTRSGVFNHQYSVVTQVRDQLANRPERLSDDGLVDNGLFAAYNALRDLSYNQFYTDEELAKRMEALASSVGRLTRTRGADHAIQVSDAVTTMSGVITKMAGTFYERTADQGGPETAPSAPDSAPAAPPATSPEPAPATPETPAAPETPPAPATPGAPAMLAEPAPPAEPPAPPPPPTEQAPVPAPPDAPADPSK